MNFSWWVNQKTIARTKRLQGGFLGLDNISVIDRSQPRSYAGGHIKQSDGTGWMGMFCFNMMAYCPRAGPGESRLRSSSK